MRLGFALYGDLSIRTGGFLYDRMLLEGLKRRGAEVEMFQLPWRNYPIALMQSVPSQELRQLAAGKFDLLLQDELAHPSLFSANPGIRRRSGTPIVAIVHHLRSSENHPGALQALYRRVERAYLNTLDGVIANSPATLAEVEGMLERRLPAVIAPPGRGHFSVSIAESEISTRSHEQGPLRILFLGSIIPRKRLGDLVAAIGRLSDPELQLTVIGRDAVAGTYTREVRSALQATLPDDHVRWLGEQPDERVMQELRESHLLIVPSTHEGFGIAYLDAMGYGVVPIGTNSGGAAALVRHADNGFLVTPGDVEALAEHIERFASNRALLESMALNARRDYQLHPTWEEVVDIVYDYIETKFVKEGNPV